MKHDRQDLLRRFAYIETCLHWGNGLTAAELGHTFGLARQTAQGIIAAYKRTYPGAMRLDPSRKRQIAGPRFVPHHIRLDAGTYLDYLRGEAMVTHYRDEQDWSELVLEDVDRLVRPRFNRELTKQVLTALHEQRVIRVRYQAKSGVRIREISPHHLVFAGNRYHIRAFCHTLQDYFDFVLTRILLAESSETEWVSDRGDAEWHKIVQLSFAPNDALAADVKDALCADYGLEIGEALKIHCRKALELYVTREMLRMDAKYSMPLWQLQDQ